MGTASVSVYLGLGSNLGERREHLQQAVVELARRGVVARRGSRLVQGPYVGPGGPQGDYLNAVVCATTHLLPLQLLDVVQEVEALRGRVHPSHMQPRPLDVDILLYGGWCICHPRLQVPHPRLWERRFVLEPLGEVIHAAHPLRPALQAGLEALRHRQVLSLVPAALVTGEALAALSS